MRKLARKLLPCGAGEVARRGSAVTVGASVRPDLPPPRVRFADAAPPPLRRGGGWGAALALCLFASPALAGVPVELRPHPVSHGATITLGDLFDGADAAGATVIARAPAVGQDAVLEAAQVQAAARAAGLDWDNASGQRRIAVTSTGGAATPRTRAPARRSAQTLAYARNLSAGEVLGPEDLVWSGEAVAPSDAVSDPDRATGQAVRRAVRAGLAVAAHDLAAPRVVRRDETLSVTFQEEGISLTLQGRALADAGVGDEIAVLNPQSKKTVAAIVTGPGQAAIGPAADALHARRTSSALALATR